MTTTYSVNTSADELVTVRTELDIHSRGTHSISGPMAFISGLDDEDCFDLAMALLIAGGFDDAEAAARRERLSHPQRRM